ncbi:hypothetical protein [Streptomyces sp. NPDC001100]
MTAGPADGAPKQPGGDNTADDKAPKPSETEQSGTEEQTEEEDRPQDAWAARRDLVDHSPRAIDVGSHARFGGSVVAGDQTAVTGDARDVYMGARTENYYIGVSAASHSSGEVPKTTLTRTDRTFVTDGTAFDTLTRRISTELALTVSGGRFTGRRTAALVALHRMGVSPIHLLARDTTPQSLPGLLAQGDNQGHGYVLCDLTTRRDQPLQEAHLLAVRDQLLKSGAYLVITVDPSAVLEDITPLDWRPPAPADVLTAHLRVLTGEPRARELLALPQVGEFLTHGHQLREVVAFAGLLSRHAAGEESEAAVGDFSRGALESQIQEWFEAEEKAVPLRDKAFLVALAAFDDGPYALTAELSDLLYTFLQETENPAARPYVPVFGTHIGKRLQLARAHEYVKTVRTEWGPVLLSKAAYEDGRAWQVLLTVVWTRHPSARPALVKWLARLARDGRPLVHTRAASTAAVLALTDLPSAMALVIEPWGMSRRYRDRLAAVNALTLGHLIGTPNIPEILDSWSGADEDALRWVAIRVYGLIGDERPEQALAALRGAARKQYEQDDEDDEDELMVDHLAASVGLLLISPASETVLAGLVAKLDDDQAVHDLAVRGFLSACKHQQDDKPSGVPSVLGWYARAAGGDGTTARGITTLWRAALGDLRHTDAALAALRDWVLAADREPAAEWALAALLPTLVATDADHQRLSHLLRTMHGEDGASPPLVAARLLTVLPRPR